MCGGERFCLSITKRKKKFIFLVEAHHFRHFETPVTIIVIARHPCSLVFKCQPTTSLIYVYVLDFMHTIGHVCQRHLSLAACLNNST